MLKVIISLICVQQIYGSANDCSNSRINTDNDFNSNPTDKFPNKYFLSYPIKTNWFMANKFCVSNGQNLITIESIDKQREIDDFIRNKQLNHKFHDWPEGIWTGGSDNGKEGTYTWITNGKEFTYSQWKIGEPNGGAGENCIALWNVTGYDSFKWYDVACTWQLYFICEQIELSIP